MRSLESKDILLDVKHLTVRFGGLVAVSKVDLEIREGELVGLIGPNGAGKTTCFNVLTGVYAPTEGTVKFAGENIENLPPHRVCEKGICRTFQNIRLFGKLTVLENILVAMHGQQSYSMFESLLRVGRFRSGHLQPWRVRKCRPPVARDREHACGSRQRLHQCRLHW